MSSTGFHPTTIHLNLVKNPQCQAINKKYKFLTQCYKSKYFDLKISNTRVVRPERTGSGETGPDHKVGPFSSLGPLQNVRGVLSDIRWQVSWFARAQTVTAICFLYSMGCLPNAYAILELTNQ